MSETDDPINLGAIPARAEEIVPRKIAGDMILVPVRGELAEMQQLFVLDEVGELVWAAMDGKLSIAEIVTQVVAQFEVDESTASRDLLEFVSELAELGLVVIQDVPTDNG